MAWQYTSMLPWIPIDPSIPKFFEDFYHVSDMPHAHNRYVELFMDDATLIMASQQAVGKEGLSLFSHSYLNLPLSISHLLTSYTFSMTYSYCDSLSPSCVPILIVFTDEFITIRCD